MYKFQERAKHLAIRELVDHVVKNDHQSIEGLVTEVGAGILHVDHEDYDKPILHIALDDEAEVVMPATIRCLMYLGADIYKEIVGQSEAIHSAVSGQNPQLLEVIVNSIQNPARLNATATGNTALNLLIKHGNRNSIGFMECLHILLNAGTDVNIADNKSMTPVLWASVRGYKDVIKAILEYGRCVDIDTHKFEEKTARDYIIQRNLYEGVLPAKKNENNVTSPLWHLENNDEGGFFKLKEIAVNDENERGTLLQHACDRGLINVVRYLVYHNVDVHKTTLKNKKIPLEIAAYNGYDEIFKILLGKYEAIPKNILTTLLRNMPLHKGAYARYKNCLNALLDSEKPIPVNERSGLNNTPLHYACLINDSSIASKLLKKGASLANRNDFDSIPIEDIDSKILHQHFDDCIVHQEFIRCDYTSILPTFDKKQEKTKDEESPLIESFNETDVIRVISEAPEFRHLLIHPLIATFIHVKWGRIRWFFCADLILRVLFTMCFFVYSFVPAFKNIVIHLIAIYIKSKLLIPSYRTRHYSLSAILEYFVFVALFCQTTVWLVNSIAMVSIVLKLMAVGAQHPRFSKYMVMLRKNAQKIFLLILCCGILIFSFISVLYNRNWRDQYINVVNELTSHVLMLMSDFDNFNNLWNSVISLQNVFLSSIILFNLFTGLAISNKQFTESEAKIVGYAGTVSYIVYLENIIHRFGNWRFNLIYKSLVQQISLIPYYFFENKVIVRLPVRKTRTEIPLRVIFIAFIIVVIARISEHVIMPVSEF